jgi:hypothetical protein
LEAAVWTDQATTFVLASGKAITRKPWADADDETGS